MIVNNIFQYQFFWIVYSRFYKESIELKRKENYSIHSGSFVASLNGITNLNNIAKLDVCYLVLLS